MDWAQNFYTRQFKLLESAEAWSRFFPAPPPAHRVRRAEAVERLSGPGIKRVLELGAGGGLTAGAIALRGHSVVAVDIVDAAATSARRIAAQIPAGKMHVVQGDFYEIELEGTFDVVCYFDGFGIGSDADQRRLLRRIAEWTKPGGCALIDVYFPGWLSELSELTSEVYREGNAFCRDEFDLDGWRLRNSIWSIDEDESQATTQSLRNYSPADFRLLLMGTGLRMQRYEPYESSFQFEEIVPLSKAEIFLAKLVHDE